MRVIFIIFTRLFYFFMYYKIIPSCVKIIRLNFHIVANVNHRYHIIKKYDILRCVIDNKY